MAKQLKHAIDRGLKTTTWVENARIEAILGSVPGSLPTIRSALRCWSMFAFAALGPRGQALPPQSEWLVAWSRLFRNWKTYEKCVCYVQFGCELLGLPVEVFGHPSIKRAKRSILLQQAPPQAKHFLRRHIVEKLVQLAKKEGDSRSALLYLMAYAFLLRVPSECLPATKGNNGLGQARGNIIHQEGDTMVLTLAKRKIKPPDSVLARKCWCCASAITCPVHAIEPLLAELADGPLFVGITPKIATNELRRRLSCLGVAGAEEHVLRDFRRGHAMDLAESGAPLWQILLAGEWKSPAFLLYLDLNKIEMEAIMEAQQAAPSIVSAVVEESDAEDET